MPTSPTSAAPAFMGIAAMGSARAAVINVRNAPSPPPSPKGEGVLVAATPAPANRSTAACRFLRRICFLDRPHRARVRIERHVVAREVTALVRSDGRAAAKAKHQEKNDGSD